ncbi:MAG: transcription termination factor Rho [Clostridiales bacterium]|nr:transcription termination factor Rho [Clostridiales bacterium]
MKEKYESLSLATLKDLAKARGLKGTSAMRKSRLIEVMLEQDEKDKAAENPEGSPKSEDPGVSEEPKRREESERSEEPKRQEESGKPEEPKRQEKSGGSEEPRRTGETKRQEEIKRTEETKKTEEYRRAGTEEPEETVRPVQRRRRPLEGNIKSSRPSRDHKNGDYRTQKNTAEPGRTYSSNRTHVEQTAASPQPVFSEARVEPARAEAMRQEPIRPETSRPELMRPETSRQETMRAENVRSEAARPETSRSADADRPPAELSQLDSGQSVSGILEVMQDGYGFIRSDNYLPGENDVYVSPSQIRRFNLKTGDIISGNTRIKSQQEKFSALLYLKKVNDLPPSEAARRCNFEDMTPIFPNERLRMERDPRATAMRIVDLFSPIGKGQRGMIVSPPKAGKTTLLKDIARSLLKNSPEMRLLILLIDERPEEVTDIKEAIRGDNVEVIYSTFDELPEHHKRVSEMVIERAKRLVEQKQDVTILLDSITRLARAYNLTVPPSGRTLSGGLDPAALHMPKRFFGAARNMREGGSLTILATALVDTGSKMDDVVYEEFKGTGNMELVLDRKLSEKRVFPAIDIPKSGTRREDLLLDREEQEAMYIMRRALNGMKSDEAVENILNMFVHTRDNRELVYRVKRQKFV